MDANCSCKVCGKSLVIEYIGNYGTIYHIRRDGTIGHRIKSVKYEGAGDYMVYCPSCGTGCDGKFIYGTYVQYEKEETE